MASGWLPLSHRTRLTARVAARFSEHLGIDASRIIPAWEDDVLVAGGPESNRGLPIAVRVNDCAYLASAEIRHDIRVFPGARSRCSPLSMAVPPTIAAATMSAWRRRAIRCRGCRPRQRCMWMRDGSGVQAWARRFASSATPFSLQRSRALSAPRDCTSAAGGAGEERGAGGGRPASPRHAGRPPSSIRALLSSPESRSLSP